MVGRVGAFMFLFVLVTFPARAERMIRPGYFIREVTSRAANGTDNRALVREEPLASLPRGIARSPNKRNGAFRKALGALVVTRDLEVPGARCLGLGLRLIPGKQALGGEAQLPFVVQAGLGPSRVGLKVGGRF